MPINYGSTRVNDVFYGNKRVLQIYHGSNLVYNAEIGLPKGYVELEYIEATNGQYIDTGVLYNNVAKAKVEAKMVSYEGSGYPTILGCATLSPLAYGVMIGVGPNGFYEQTGSGGQGYIYHSYPFDLNKHTFITDTINKTMTIDDTMDTYEHDKSSINLNVYLLRRNINGDTLGSACMCRCYSCKLWNNDDKLIANMIPAMRTSDGKIGMYDLHRRKFLTNADTGEFIAGNFVLPKGYDELEYIESTGTQYIDTLYKPNNNTKFYINYNVTGAAGSSVANVPYGVTNISPNVDKAGNGLFRTISGSSSFNRVAWGDETIGSNSNNSLSSHAIVYGQWVSDYYDQNEIYIDNDLVYTSTTNPLTVWNSTNNLYIFARNNQGHVDFNSAMKLKLAYVTENNLYKMYLKPARKISDGTVGMYDLINNKFLTNAGTGDFIIPTN